jgi:hypothetical protein
VNDAELQKATSDRNDRPTPNRRGAHVSDAVEELFAEALAVDQFDRPGVLLDWWDRVKAAALDAPRPASGLERGADEPRPPVPPSAPDLDSSGPTIEVDASRPSIDVSGPGPTVHVRPDRDEFEPGRDSAPPRRRRPSRGIWAAVAVLSVAAAGVGALVIRAHTPLECSAGLADCNEDRSDGCETDVRREDKHCGACGHACATGESCTDGRCQSSRCPLEHLRDCNKVSSDGCEVDVRSDSKNCGECGRICGSAGAKQAACVDSKCEISCRPGFGNCDDMAENGCEVLFSADAKNCGRCGVPCANGSCVEGVCAPKMILGPLRARHFFVRGDTLFFWNGDQRRIDRVGGDGLQGTVVDHVDDVTGLVVTSDRVVWAGGAKNEIQFRPLDGGAVTRAAGPVASETPIFLSAAGYLTWSNRAHRTEEPVAAAKGKARPVLASPPTPRSLSFVSVDALGDRSRVASAECNQWPAAFVGGPDNQYCCDRKQAVTLVECKGTSCAYRPIDATCPDAFADDGDRIYFPEETRIVVLDRKTGKLTVLSKRKRQARGVTIGGDFVYWLEGEPIADIFRIKKSATDPSSAEMIARRQVNAAELAAGEHSVFWAARAPEAALPGPASSAKRAPPKSSPGQSGDRTPAGPIGIYVLVFKEN